MTDWTTLEHAYGPASDVPDLLDSIGTENPRAVEALAGRIAHQGWASCEAATASVPRLYELARDTEKVRGAIAVLLANLACLGDHEHFMAGGFGRDAMMDGVREEPAYAELTAAVEAGSSAAIEWLGGADAAGRAGAAVLLAVTQPKGGLEALTAAAAAEKSRATRSDMHAALGWFEDADIKLLRAGFARKTPDRFGAAVGLAMRDVLDEEIASVLAAPASMKGSHWAAGDIRRHGISVLVAACGRLQRSDILHASFAGISDDQRADVAAQLIKLEFAEQLDGFQHGKSKPLTTPALDSLTPGQRGLLEELVKYESGWPTSDQTYWLQQLGFWNSRAKLATYLGHVKPNTILDREVTIDGAAITLRDWLVPVMTKGADTTDIAAQVTEMLSASDAVEVAELLLREAVPSGFSARSFRMRVFVGAHDAGLLRDRIAALVRRGRWVTFDNAKGTACVDSSLEDDLFAALLQLDPSAERPEGLRIDHTQRRLALQDPATKFGADVAEWIEAAIG